MRNSPACRMRSLLLLVLTALPRFEGNVVGDVGDKVIIGGHNIDICEAPHMVALLYRNEIFCGGSIIDEHTILTAAHCLDSFKRPDKISVRYGSSFFNTGGKVEVAEALKVHEKWDPKTVDYDAGLIRLKGPIKFGKNAKPIALPEKSPGAGTTVRVSGWGETKKPKHMSRHLKAVDIDIVEWNECKEAYPDLTGRMICAARPGKDSCQGDSGGGMDYNGTIVGIVSYGNQCAVPGYPGVYTNVADPEILKFIKSRLN